MPRGGKREGAGAKPRTPYPTFVRSIRFTEWEWDKIVYDARAYGLTPSEYIRRKVLLL